MKTVIEMAQEAGLFDSKIGTWSLPSLIVVELERFAALVREDEREKQNHSEQDLNMVQEPVAVYAFRRKGLDDFCTCDKRRYLELSEKPNLFETAIFYTIPPTAALAACNWMQPTYYDAECNAWQTDCGDYFAITEGKPSENNMKFCHHCGKALVEHPYVEPEESE